MPREITFKTIDEYIAQSAPALQERLQTLRRTIQAAAPKANEKISWAMPTFYQGGNLIHFAAFKQHIGLFPGAEGIEAFKDKFAGLHFSKGALQLPNNQPLPLDLITEIVKYRVAQNEMIVPKKERNHKAVAHHD